MIASVLKQCQRAHQNAVGNIRTAENPHNFILLKLSRVIMKKLLSMGFEPARAENLSKSSRVIMKKLREQKIPRAGIEPAQPGDISESVLNSRV